MKRLTDKRMRGEGFIQVDPKEYKDFVRNEKPTAKQIYQRLLEIEDILGDDYDLNRLRIIVNQCMTMREEVAERFGVTRDIPVDKLRYLVTAYCEGRCFISNKKGSIGDYIRREDALSNVLWALENHMSPDEAIEHTISR